MSDSNLRKLERRFRSSGSVVDEVEYLRERIRVGAITPERVEIAAYLGHEAAVAALGEEAPDVLAADDMPGYRTPILQITRSDLDYLTDVGEWWGQEFCFRFAIAAAIHAIAAQQRNRKASAAAAAHVEAARECLRTAELRLLDGRTELGPPPSSDNNLSWVCRGLHWLSSPGAGPPGWREETMSLYLARTVVAAARVGISSRPAQRRERTALLAVARAEMVPWALGTGDPVRERHRA